MVKNVGVKALRKIISLISALSIALSQTLIGTAYVGTAYASDNNVQFNNAVRATGQLLINGLNKHSTKFGLQWVEGEFGYSKKNKFEFGLTSFSVFKETSNTVFISQNSISKKYAGTTVNLGLGIRKLVSLNGTDKAIIGLNAFYDFRDGTSGIFDFAGGIHKRYSVGLELKTSKFDTFTNSYKKISNAIGGEQVLSGYDFGVSGKIPNYENFSLSATHYNFTGDVKSLKGNKFGLEYKPNAVFTTGIEYDKSHTQDSSLNVFVNVELALDKPFDEQLSEIVGNSSNVWDKRYDKIKRDNVMHIEEVDITNSMVISVANISVIEGNEKVFTVNLNKKIALDKNIIIGVKSTDLGVATVNVKDLTFTSTTWNEPQKVTVTGVEDVDTDSNRSAKIQLTIEKSSTDDVVGMSPVEINVVVQDVMKSKPAKPEVNSVTEFWSIPIFVTTIAGQIYEIHKTVGNGMSYDERTGRISATKPGTAKVRTKRTATDTDKESVWSEYTVVTFTETDNSGDQAVAPTVNNKIAPWVETITVTRIDGQEYEFTTASKGITYNSATGIVEATQSGTAKVRTKVLAKNGHSAGAWSPPTILTFTRQEQVLNSATPDDDLWSTGIQVTGSSNRDDAPASSPGDYTYVVDDTNPGDAAGTIVVSDTGLVSGATSSGTVNVKVSRAKDGRYLAAEQTITVTFTETDNSGDQAVAPTVNNKIAPWVETITVTRIDGQEYEFTTASKGITYNSATGIVEATQSGTANVKTKVLAKNGHSAGAWSPPTILTFTRQEQVLNSATPDDDLWSTGIQVTGSSNRDDAPASSPGDYTYVVDDTNPGDAAGAIVVSGTGLVSGATSSGTVNVKVSRAKDGRYLAAHEVITVTFTETDNSRDQAVAPTVNNKIAPWVETITVTLIDGQEYELTNASKGITYNSATGIVEATQSGTAKVRTKVLAKNGHSAGAWSPPTILTFTRQEQVLNSATPDDDLWSTGIQVTGSSNRDDAPASSPGDYTYVVDDTNPGDAAGTIVVSGTGLVSGATSSGTVNVKVSRAKDGRYLAAEQTITVTFTETDNSGDQAVAPTVNNKIAPWVETITVTRIDGQEYEFTTASKGITYNSATGIVEATQSGTAKVRTKVLAKNGHSAGAWSPPTILTFTRQEQVLNSATPDDDLWSTGIQVTGSSNRDDAPASSPGDYTYVVDDTNPGDAAGTIVVSDTGLVSGATSSGTVNVKVSRAKDGRYLAAEQTITVTFTETDNSRDQAVAPTVNNKIAPWVETITVTLIDGQEYELTNASKGITYNSATGIVEATQSGTAKVRTKVLAKNGHSAGAWSPPTILTFTRQEQVLNSATPDDDLWSTGIQVTGSSNRDDAPASSPGDYTYVVDDTNPGDAAGAIVVSGTGLVSGATSSGTVNVKVSRAKDGRYLAAEQTITVTFTETDNSRDQAVAPTVNNKIAPWVETITVTLIDGQEYELTNASKGITYNSATGIVEATQSGTAKVRTKVLAKNGHSAGAWSPPTILTFTRQEQVLNSATPDDDLWSTGIQVTGSSNRDDAPASSPGDYTYVVDDTNPGDAAGAIVVSGTGLVSGATSSGTVNVKVSRAKDGRYLAAHEVITVTFTETDNSRDQAVAPTVNNKIAPWVETITVTLIDGQEYELTNASKGITYNSATGIVEATQSGTAKVRTKVLAKNGHSAGAWSPPTILTFTRQEQVLNSATPDDDLWSTGIQVTGSSNRDDAPASSPGDYTYVVDDTNPGDAAGAIVVSGTGLVSGATSSGTVNVKVSRAKDGRYLAAHEVITVTFTETDNSRDQAVAPTVNNKIAPWVETITVTLIDGQEYELTNASKGITYNSATGIVEATQSGTAKVRTKVLAKNGHSAGAWSPPTILTFTRQEQVLNSATPDDDLWSTGIQVTGSSNRDDAPASSPGDYTYVVDDTNPGDAAGAIVVSGTGLVSGATSSGTVNVKVSRAKDGRYLAAHEVITVTFTETDNSRDQAVAPTVNNKIAPWVETITVTLIDGQEYELTNASKGITYNSATGIVEATQSGTAKVRTKVLAKNGHSAGAWSPPTILTFTRQEQVLNSATPDDDLWSTGIQVTGSSNRDDAPASSPGDYTYVVDDTNPGDAAGTIVVSGTGLVSGATSSGTVNVKVSRAKDGRYLAAHEVITVTFTETDNSRDQAVAPTVNNKIAPWVETITVTRIDGQEYEFTTASKGITYNSATGIVEATQSGTANVKTKVLAKNGHSAGAWSPPTILTFTRQEQVLNSATPDDDLWSTGIQVTGSSNRDDAPASSPGDYTYVVDDTNPGDAAGTIVVSDTGLVSGATSSGTVNVKVSRAKDGRYLAAEQTITVTFTETDNSGDRAVAPTVNNEITPWVETITVTRIDGQEYELANVSNKGITYNKSTGIVEATQSGTANVRTKVLAKNGHSAGAWSPSTILTFTRQEQVLNSAIPDDDFWSTGIQVTGSSNRDDAPASPPGDYTYVVDVTNPGDAAGTIVVSDTGLVSGATSSGTVNVKVSRAKDGRYLAAHEVITVTFTETDNSRDQAVAPTVNNKIAPWVETITVTLIDGQEYELTNASKGITYNSATGIVEATQSGTAKVRTKVLAKNGHSAGAWSPPTILTFTRQEQVLNSATPDDDLWSTGIQVTGSSNRDDAPASSPGDYTYVVDDTNPGDAAGTIVVSGTGLVSGATSSGTVNVKVSRAKDGRYLAAEQTITVTFTETDNSGDQAVAPTVNNKIAPWVETITVTRIDGQEYEFTTASKGITYNSATGIVEATQSGTAKVRTKVLAKNGHSAGAWSPPTILTFTRQEQVLNSATPDDDLWSTGIQVTGSSNRDDAPASSPGDYTYVVDDTNPGDAAGTIVVSDTGLVSGATSSGTVNVKVSRAKDGRYLAAEQTITVTFTETDNSRDQAVAPTVNNKIAPWVETITVTLIDGQEYELTNASKGITYNSATGIVEATQSGTAKVRTKVLAKNGHSAGAWSPPTILTFTRQEQVLNSATPDDDLWSTGIQVTGSSNRDDAPASSPGDYTYVVDDTNPGDAAGAIVVSGTGLVSGATSSGTVNVKVSRAKDGRYLAAEQTITVTFTETDNSRDQAVAPTVNNKIAPWVETITVTLIDGQEYELTNASKGITYNSATGIVEATQSGTAKVRTKVLAKNGHSAGAWSPPTILTFTRQEQVLNSATPDDDLWSTGIQVTGSSNRDDAPASSPGDYTYVVDDTNPGDAAGAIVVSGTGLVSGATSSGTVNVKVSRAKDGRYLAAHEVITVTFTETDNSRDQAVAPTVNNKIAPWVETITVTLIDGQEYELTNASKGITYNSATGIVEATQSGTAKVRTKVLAKNGHSAGAWSPPTILTFTRQEQVLNSATPDDDLWSTGIQVTGSSNRDDAPASSPGDYTYVVDDTNPGDAAGAIVVSGTGLVSGATSSGTVNVKVSRAKDGRYLAAHEVITVTFTETDNSRDQAVAPTVNNKIAPWVETITVTLIDGQEYELTNASKGITYNSATGIVEATQSGTAKVRTKVLAKNGHSAGAWSPPTILTFTRQEQVLNSATPDDDLWSTGIQVTGSSNRDDAPASSPGDYTYVVDDTNPGDAAGAIVVSGTGLVSGATSSGTVNVKVSRAKDGRYLAAHEVITVTFTETDNSRDQAVAPTVNNKIAPWVETITVTLIDGQEYELTNASKGITYNSATGIVEATQSGTAKVRTKVLAKNGHSAGAWSPPTILTFTRQEQVLNSATPDDDLWSTGIQVTGSSNRDDAPASSPGDYTYVVDDTNPGDAAGAIVVSGTGLVSGATSSGTVNVKVSRAKDGRYLAAHEVITVTFTETDNSRDQAVAPTVNNKIASWVETITVTLIDGQEYELTNASKGITYNSATGIVEATQSGTANVKTKVLAKNGHSAGAWSPPTILTFTRQEQVLNSATPDDDLWSTGIQVTGSSNRDDAPASSPGDYTYVVDDTNPGDAAGTIVVSDTGLVSGATSSGTVNVKVSRAKDGRYLAAEQTITVTFTETDNSGDQAVAPTVNNKIAPWVETITVTRIDGQEYEFTTASKGITYNSATGIVEATQSGTAKVRTKVLAKNGHSAGAWSPPTILTFTRQEQVLNSATPDDDLWSTGIQVTGSSNRDDAPASSPGDYTYVVDDTNPGDAAGAIVVSGTGLVSGATSSGTVNVKVSRAKDGRYLAAHEVITVTFTETDNSRDQAVAPTVNNKIAPWVETITVTRIDGQEYEFTTASKGITYNSATGIVEATQSGTAKVRTKVLAKNGHSAGAWSPPTILTFTRQEQVLNSATPDDDLWSTGIQVTGSSNRDDAPASSPGDYTYVVDDTNPGDAAGAIVVSGTGLVSGATSSGTVNVKVSRAKDGRYLAAHEVITVTFTETDNSRDQAVAPTVNNKIAPWVETITVTLIDGQEYELTNASKGITYNSATGIVEATQSGTAKVRTKVLAKNGHSAGAWSPPTILTFTRQEQVLNSATPDDDLWSTGIQVTGSSNRDDAPASSPGDYTYVVDDTNPGDAAGTIVVSDTGLVSGATSSGTVNVKVSRAKDGRYLAAEQTITVTFTETDNSGDQAVAPTVNNKIAPWVETITVTRIDGQEYEFTTASKGITYNSATGIVEATQSGTANVKTKVLAKNGHSAGAWSPPTILTFTRQEQVLNSATPDDDLWSTGIQVTGSSNRDDAPASSPGDYTYVVDDTNPGDAAGTIVVSGTGLVSGATSSGTVNVKVSRAKDGRYLAAHEVITVTFTETDNSRDQAVAPTVNNKIAPWVETITVTRIDGQEYEFTTASKGITYNSATGIVEATQSGTANVKTKVLAKNGHSAGAWSPPTILTFTRQEQVLNSATPDDDLWSTGIQVTGSSNRDDAPASSPGDYTYVVDDTNPGDAAGTIVVSDTGLVSGATSSGTVNVKVSRAKDGRYLAAEQTITVTFTETDNSGDRAVAPTVNNEITPWVETITVTRIDGQEYELANVSNKGITYNKSTGIVEATQSGTANVRTKVLAKNGHSAGAWSPSTILTFTRQEQVLNSAIPDDDFWSTGIQVTGSSNRDDAPASPPGDYTYVVDVTNPGDAAGTIVVSDTGLVSGATSSGTVNVKVYRAKDGRYLAAEQTITVTFTETDNSGYIPDKPVVTVSGNVANVTEWGGTPMIVREIAGQEYEILPAKGVSYVNGNITGTQSGLVQVRTRIAAVVGKNNVSAWSEYSRVRFKRQTRFFKVIRTPKGIVSARERVLLDLRSPDGMSITNANFSLYSGRGSVDNSGFVRSYSSGGTLRIKIVVPPNLRDVKYKYDVQYVNVTFKRSYLRRRR